VLNLTDKVKCQNEIKKAVAVVAKLDLETAPPPWVQHMLASGPMFGFGQPSPWAILQALAGRSQLSAFQTPTMVSAVTSALPPTAPLTASPVNHKHSAPIDHPNLNVWFVSLDADPI
jgi:hypothetical protein